VGDTAGRIDVSTPSAARIYDYFLGGAHNFEVDRLAAAELARLHPAIGLGMRANRSYLRRVVRYLLDAGVDQFLDLGSGIPTVGNVHQIAHRVNPEARVVYVDIEPMAIAHSDTLLAENKWAAAVCADLRRPDEVLATAEVRGQLDFDRPIAVILAGVLQYLSDDEDPAGVIAGYRDRLVPGSYLAMSHPSADPLTAQRLRGRCTPRTKQRFAAFFAGLDIIAPGIVPMWHWRPEEGDPEPLGDGHVAGHAGVGRTTAT
jgi:O-methyltransferase involved in polyketide biosynthesis